MDAKEKEYRVKIESLKRQKAAIKEKLVRCSCLVCLCVCWMVVLLIMD